MRESEEAFLRAHYRKKLERAGKSSAVEFLDTMIRFEELRREPLPSGGERMIIRVYRVVADLEHTAARNDDAIESWVSDGLAVGEGSSLSKDDLHRIALRVADPPSNARLVRSAFDRIGDREVFIAAWHHFEDGMRVESDSIHVVLNAATGRPFSFRKHWFPLTTEWSELPQE